MNLPDTRNTTYTAGSQVKSADLDAMQDLICEASAVFRMHQNWVAPMLASWTAYTFDGATTGAVINAAANKPGVWMKLHGLTGTAGIAAMYSPVILSGPWPAAQKAVIRFRVDTTSIAGAVAYRFQAGLAKEPTVPGSTLDFVKVYKSSASANWFFKTGSTATVATSTDTGVAATGVQKIRIEVYGANDAGGARALCYINDVLVATHTTNLPTADQLSEFCQLENTGAAATLDVYVSPMSLSTMLLP